MRGSNIASMTSLMDLSPKAEVTLLEILCKECIHKSCRVGSSCVLVVVGVEEVGRDVPSSLESLHQPPLRAAYPVMRTPQEDSLPH